MKKLNNKGFTLVELLAVIIILAIVVGITVPAVLTTTTNAKKKAFETAAQTVATWVDSQYQVAVSGLNGTGLATLDANFSAQCGATGSSCTAATAKQIKTTASGAAGTAAKAFVTASGMLVKNVTQIDVKINPNTGRSCVTLYAASGGDYYGAITDNKVSGGVC